MSTGLQKKNGRGRNSMAAPCSDTKVVMVGRATFYGKSAKRAQYLLAAQKDWESQKGGRGFATAGTQKPGSLKCR